MSNNKQSSSVEWLYNKMYEHRGNITIEEFEQAKAMHKEEMIDAWMDGDARIPEEMSRKEAEYYYNRTFGGNK